MISRLEAGRVVPENMTLANSMRLAWGLGVSLDLLTPWAVRFWHPAWAYVKVAAGYTLGVSLLCLIGGPLMDMWWDA